MFNLSQTLHVKNQKGLSLIELLIVVATIGFLVLLMNNIPSAISSVGKSRHQSIAREVVSKQIEDKRAMAYDNIPLGTQNITDSRMSLLPGGTGSIVVEACPVTVCTQSEAVKQISATVTWKEGNKTETITLSTLLSQGGLNQ